MRFVKWVAGVGFVLLAVAAGAAWWQREAITTWYVVRGLTRAGDADRAAWVKRATDAGPAIVAPLVDALADADDQACVNLLDALESLAAVEPLAKPFPKLGPVARAEILRRLPNQLTDEAAVTAAGKILADAAELGDLAAVDLAEKLLGLKVAAQLPAVRAAAKSALQSTSAETRLKGVRLCLRPEVEMLDQVVGLLRDPSAEVRRAAVLAVGPAEQVCREDILLAGLHDDDEEVCRLTEAALRGRGLRPEHLELGRLLTHPKPVARLQVLDRIRDMLGDESGDLDPGVWMRRLSHDSSPAVRAAALRLMSQQTVVDLSDRVDQMARSDPSPSVSQLARFYRARRNSYPLPGQH